MKEAIETFETRIGEIAREFSDRFNVEPSVFNVREYVQEAHTAANNAALELIPIHSRVLELAIGSMLAFGEYVRKPKYTIQHSAFASVHHRATNSLLGIQTLLLNGYEDTARALSRSCIEYLCLGLVFVTHAELAEEYS